MQKENASSSSNSTTTTTAAANAANKAKANKAKAEPNAAASGITYGGIPRNDQSAYFGDIASGKNDERQLSDLLAAESSDEELPVAPGPANSCPICNVELPTNMSNEAVNAHLDECLSKSVQGERSVMRVSGKF